MNNIYFFVGDGSNLTMLQMCVRAFSMFFIMMFLIRIAGRRTFAKRSSFDSIIVMMLGAILARGVVGASPYWSTVAAAIVMVVLHRLVAWLTVKNKLIEKLVKGDAIELFSKETILKHNLENNGISENDLNESLRLETKSISLKEIDKAFLETGGRISFILKEKEEKKQM